MDTQSSMATISLSPREAKIKQLKQVLPQMKNLLKELKQLGEKVDLDKVADHDHNPYNIVLGGSSALLLMGLNTAPSEDIDLVIYQPTEKQIEYLETISPLGVDNSMSYKRRVYSFTIAGVKVDFLLSQRDKPSNLPTISLEGIKMELNSVDEIVRAKTSYKIQTHEGYSSRSKDVQQLQYLKNNNFNY